MTSKSNITRIFYTLAMTAAIVLASGSFALALGDEASSEDSAPQVTGTQTPSVACPCGNWSADGEAAGSGCPGRNARRGGKGMQHRRGQGQAQGMEQGEGQAMGRGRGQKMGRGSGGGCPMQQGQSMGQGMGQGMGRAMGMGQGVMEATHSLVHDYRQDIVREVEDVENGVATTTRSPDDPEAVAALQRHVGEMKGLLGDGGRIRDWDPLFSEIFDYSDEIEMVVETLPDGVRVVETSNNPEVVKLIRAHARKVSEFVARGPAAVHEATPLPDGYRGSE
jgi:hypothetical protein